ncbi:MAG: tetratricopeptide repeat protein [Treponema sp.]|jgi:tetratricopeptide (TPR) repeat protein|nr:tetratricopeptide repeat protein [Treponema sp.]
MSSFPYLLFAALFALQGGLVFSASPDSRDPPGSPLPGWFTRLRDAVYEQQLKAGEVEGIFESAKERALEEPEPDRYILLARCEFMMGRAFLFDERTDEARDCFDRGIRWAESALNLKESSQGWQMLAENFSASCRVKPVSWVIANGTKVEKYARNALALDSGNAAAQYLIASRYVYAPAPFNNLKKGIDMMQEILTGFDKRLDKDDRFNVWSSIGYAYFQQKKYAAAAPWLEKSLIIYPTNKFVGDLLEKCKNRGI